MKIAHLTSVHQPNDIRIFYKECISLAKAKHDVTLVCAGAENKVEEGVQIIGVPKATKRINRMHQTVNFVFKKALEVDADTYHLHDPELLRIASKLKKAGKKVIYDAHEDLPQALLSRPYLPKSVRKIIAGNIGNYENKIASQLDAVIAATPYIGDRFNKINPNTVVINNYPLLSEISTTAFPKNINEVCYTGGITAIRGIENIVKAMASVQGVKLSLAGPVHPVEFKNKLQQTNGWQQINDLGAVNRDMLFKIFSRSFAGLVTFLPYPNHINAQPNKLFEYMSAGLPVIASNFPLWKEIIEGGKCGICVDPSKPTQIASAIITLKKNPTMAEEMGANGKKLIQEKYNWGEEEKKLLNLYS